MKGFIYLTKRTFINRLKRAVKKPVTYLYGALMLLYAVLIIGAIAGGAAAGGIDDPKGLVLVLTVWIYFQFCSNFLVYARLKGIIFKPAHTHLIFPAPVSPKMVLLHAALLNYMLSFLIAALALLVSIFIFHVPVWRGFLLFAFMFAIETAFEVSLMIFLYSGEKRYKGLIRVLQIGIVLLIVCILGGIALFFRRHGLTVDSLWAFLDAPALRLIPVAGWNVAAVEWIVCGPTRINMIGTILYLAAALGMALTAYKMRCTGEFYEDAAKFADDYAKMKARSRKGESSLKLKKRRLGSGRFQEKGTNAKAIFYKQILEYKKERFFIFSGMTLACLIGAGVCIFGIGKPDDMPLGIVLMGAAAYIGVIGIGYMGKWGKELEKPYIYLIPDTPARKLWYATALEHVKAFVDGVLFAVPVGIAWDIPAYQILSIIATYVVLQANRLYLKVLSDSLIGNSLGMTGKQMVILCTQGGVIGMGALLGLVFYMVNEKMVFLIFPLYSMIITVLIAALTVPKLENMEQWD